VSVVQASPMVIPIRSGVQVSSIGGGRRASTPPASTMPTSMSIDESGSVMPSSSPVVQPANARIAKPRIELRMTLSSKDPSP
jgi:hypothetical protein